MSKKKLPTLGSEFSGVGGFDLAAELAGFDVVWQAEIDGKASKILDRHFPMAHNYGDVKNVTKKKEKAFARFATDVVCGGSPCQDISVANQDREGLAGAHSGLFYEFARTVRTVRPEWFVFENVDGLLTSNGGKDLAIVIGCLTGRVPSIPKLGWSNSGFGYGTPEGYKIAWRVFDSQFDGVAQRRRRIYIVGHREDLWRPVEVLCDEEIFARRTPTSRRAWSVELDSRRITYDPKDDSGEQVDSWRILFNDANGIRKDRPDGGFYVYANEVVGTLTVAGKAGDTLISGTVSAKWKKQSSGPSGDEVRHLVWQGHHAKDVIRESDDDLAPTLLARAGTGGNNVTMVGARRLTPEECELLQGFPKGWTGGQADSHRYEQLGNAVNVSTAYWIFTRLKRVMEMKHEPK